MTNTETKAISEDAFLEWAHGLEWHSNPEQPIATQSPSGKYRRGASEEQLELFGTRIESSAEVNHE